MMHSRKVISGLAALAVGGALAFGGCGGSDDSSTSGSKPAAQTTGDSMKHDAMKDGGAAMKHDDAMKGDDDSMKHDDGAMHDQGDDNGAMHDDG